MNINELIKSAREKKKISQRELGRRINKTGQYISYLEKNSSAKPGIDLLYDIAEALEINVYELIDPQTEKDLIVKNIFDIQKRIEKAAEESDILFEEVLKRYDILNIEGKLEFLKRIDDLRLNKSYRSDKGFNTGLPDSDTFDRHLKTIEDIKAETK